MAFVAKLFDRSSSASLYAVSWNCGPNSALDSTWSISDTHGEVSPRYARTAVGLVLTTGLSSCPLLDVVVWERPEDFAVL